MPDSRIILVSGANRGIGFEICRQLSEQGHRLILGSRDLNKGNAARQKLSGDIHCVELDLMNPQTFSGVYSFINKNYGRLDVLVNNAGITGSSLGFEQVKGDEINQVLKTNLLGPVQLTGVLIPLLKKSAHGRIINVSSGMGGLDNPGRGYAAYRLSKASLNAFSILLAEELSGTHIKVNAVCPGWVRTDMGGKFASRSVQKGAETIVWLATAAAVPDGKFLRDKKVINW